MAFLLVASFSVRADTINWTNTTSGGWNTAANWNPNSVPGTTDIAIITNAGVTVSLNGTTTVGAIILGTNGAGTVTLSLNNQTLALNGPLTVNPSGSFTVDSGALGGNTNAVLHGANGWSAGLLEGILTLASDSTLNITTTNNHDMPNCTLTNNGTVAWASGQIRAGGNPGTFIYNYGLWDAQSDQQLNDAFGGTIGVVFNNFGTFRKEFTSGTTTIASGVTFNNTGKLDAQDGNIALQYAYTLANGTKMSFGLGGSAGNGSISLSGAASFAGSLSVNLNGFYWPGVGSSFNLLNYTFESGVLFTNTTLPAPGYITWQTNYNATAFMLSVVAHIATNTTPTNMFISTLNSSNLILQWPGDHTGWRIQAQTNPLTVGINTNWAILAGSSLTNQFVMPLGKTNGSVFFRMIYP